MGRWGAFSHISLSRRMRIYITARIRDGSTDWMHRKNPSWVGRRWNKITLSNASLNGFSSIKVSSELDVELVSGSGWTAGLKHS